jgi:hypothetical protein
MPLKSFKYLLANKNGMKKWWLVFLFSIVLVHAVNADLTDIAETALSMVFDLGDDLVFIKFVLWFILFIALSEITKRFFPQSRGAAIMMSMLVSLLGVKFMPEEFLFTFVDWLGIILMGVVFFGPMIVVSRLLGMPLRAWYTWILIIASYLGLFYLFTGFDIRIAPTDYLADFYDIVRYSDVATLAFIALVFFAVWKILHWTGRLFVRGVPGMGRLSGRAFSGIGRGALAGSQGLGRGIGQGFGAVGGAAWNRRALAREWAARRAQRIGQHASWFSRLFMKRPSYPSTAQQRQLTYDINQLQARGQQLVTNIKRIIQSNNGRVPKRGTPLYGQWLALYKRIENIRQIIRSKGGRPNF